MKLSKYLAALGLLLLSRGAIATCDGAVQKHVRIQWSESAKVVSPGGGWQLEVHPALTSDENSSHVSLRRCRDGRSSELFTLERTAEVYWRSDGGGLLVIDQPTADTSRLIVLNTKLLFNRNPSNQAFTLGDKLQKDVQQRLGISRHIAFYLVNFVSWSDGTLTLDVGGATSPGTDGPMTPYCYGALLDSDEQEVKSLISDDDLQSKINKARCKLHP